MHKGKGAWWMGVLVVVSKFGPHRRRGFASDQLQLAVEEEDENLKLLLHAFYRNYTQ